MTAAVEPIRVTTLCHVYRVLRQAGDLGIRVRIHDGRVTALCGKGADPTTLDRVRALKDAIAITAPSITWRCQTMLWPVEVWMRYDQRVRDLVSRGADRDLAEQLAYPDFAEHNVLIVQETHHAHDRS